MPLMREDMPYYTRILIPFAILAWAVFEKGASGWWFWLMLLFM